MRLIAPKDPGVATEQRMATHFSSRGQSFRYPDDLVAEHTMEIYLNDTPAYEVVCSPTDLPELVLGRLLSDGVIQSTDEVELLYLCENGLRAKVYLPGLGAGGRSAGGGAGEHLLYRQPNHCQSVSESDPAGAFEAHCL